jgi:hypothetical protein
MGDAIHKYMREFLLNIIIYDFLISKRAYVGIYLFMTFITLRAFKSLYLVLSLIVYFFIRKQDVFCLSALIPKITN